MLAQAIWVIWHGNRHSIVDSHSNVIFIVKLIQKTDVFGIQPGYCSPKSSESGNFFAKSFAIINIGVPLNNLKKHARKNWDQSKNWSNILKLDEGNANVERNNGVTLDSDYDSDNMWKAMCPAVLSDY